MQIKQDAEISGNPLALASALQKIEQYSKLPMPVNPAVSQLFISDPLKAFSREWFWKIIFNSSSNERKSKKIKAKLSGIRY